jgi:hypothetical protein
MYECKIIITMITLIHLTLSHEAATASPHKGEYSKIEYFEGKSTFT